jgi:hypothetical protein
MTTAADSEGKGGEEGGEQDESKGRTEGGKREERGGRAREANEGRDCWEGSEGREGVTRLLEPGRYTPRMGKQDTSSTLVQVAKTRGGGRGRRRSFTT